MPQKILILPFIEEGKDRKKPFTYQMEIASILCLAEAKRRKKPGVLGSQPEKISYISKLYYPFWAVPLDNEAFFVDGLGINNTNINYKIPLESEIYLKQLEKAKESRDIQLILQRSHKDTFKNFIAEIQIPILGLLTDRELVSTLPEYAKQGKKTLKEMEEHTFIRSKLNENLVLEIAEKISLLNKKINEEINSLEKTANILREEMQQIEEKIQGEIEELEKNYEIKLATLREEVEKKIEALTKEKEEIIQKITKLREEELKPLIKEKQKNEIELKRLKKEEESLKRRKDLKKTGNTYEILILENKIQENKNKILLEKGKSELISTFIEQFKKEIDTLLQKLSEDYEKKIDDEKNRILQLEALRDQEITSKQNELNEFHVLIDNMISMVEALIAEKQIEETRLKELTVPLTLETPTLLYIPFYLIKFETEKKSRYHAKTPSIAIGHAGIIRKIQKTLRRFSLEARINHLLHSRSRILDKLIASTFIETLEKDKTLERNISNTARNNNLIKKTDLKEVLTKGLQELRDEEWIKIEEKEAVLEAYLPKTLIS
jgi:hypothetical protein